MRLNPDDLRVDSFETAVPELTSGMKTYEPGCTTPDLCPIGVIARPRTMEPDCTADLCQIGVVAARPPVGMNTREPGCTDPELCGDTP